MANKVQVGGNGSLFVGEDKTLSLEVLDTNAAPIDMTGWTVTLQIRDPNTVYISTTCTISGTYNVTRSVNTQRANRTLSAAETRLFQARRYDIAWKRTDNNLTVLAYGDFVPELTTQR